MSTGLHALVRPPCCFILVAGNQDLLHLKSRPRSHTLQLKKGTRYSIICTENLSTITHSTGDGKTPDIVWFQVPCLPTFVNYQSTQFLDALPVAIPDHCQGEKLSLGIFFVTFQTWVPNLCILSL